MQCIYIRHSFFSSINVGFVTGKRQAIPWGALVKSPASWMLPDCIPDGFEWKDPSKIQIGEVFRLLAHWNARQDEELDPLIWAPTCPFLQDGINATRRVRAARHIRELNPPDFDEETFVLPSSDDIDTADSQEHLDNLGAFFERHDGSDGGQSASVVSHDSGTDTGHSGESYVILCYHVIVFRSSCPLDDHNEHMSSTPYKDPISRSGA